MKRIIRDRLLTDEEAAKYQSIRDELEQKRENWRKKHVYPLEELFRSKGIFFTTNIFDMERNLSEKWSGEETSCSNMMATLVSPEAAQRYREMLRDPFPWV